MSKTIDVLFRDGMRIDADFGDFCIPTDQPVKDGGQGEAPSPFDLFLASLATCAGVYARRFCQSRKLSTEGLGVHVTCDFAEKGFRMERMTFEITPPAGFPDKYLKALERTVGQCAVKKHVVDPPEFAIVMK